MSYTKQIAKHFKEVYFGGNWACSNLKEQLADVNWNEANTKIKSLNTIAVLTYHIHYYVEGVGKFLSGSELDMNDKFSFDCPPINSDEEWEAFKNNVLQTGKQFAKQLEGVSEEKLLQTFVDEKYGIYYRNFHGIIEHCHYHLGQIAVIKKLVKFENI